MPKALWWSSGGWRFLMSEVTLTALNLGALWLFKPSATFERGFKTGSPSKSAFTLRL